MSQEQTDAELAKWAREYADYIRQFGDLHAAEQCEAIASRLEPLREIANRKPPAGTVRVRAAVAMAADGSWSIDGHSGQSDDACGVNAASARTYDFLQKNAIDFIGQFDRKDDDKGDDDEADSTES